MASGVGVMCHKPRNVHDLWKLEKERKQVFPYSLQLFFQHLDFRLVSFKDARESICVVLSH